jgi:glycogen synthase
MSILVGITPGGTICGLPSARTARTAWLRLAGGPAERRRWPPDTVIALTLAAAGRLAGEGIPESQIRVIPPGYDPDLFAADAPDPFPDPGRPRVGYIGRIAPQKDVGTLISAFGRLTGPACLLIVGDGSGRRAAEAQARRLAGPVRFTGFAPTRGSSRCCGTSTCWSWPPGTRSCPRR